MWLGLLFNVFDSGVGKIVVVKYILWYFVLVIYVFFVVSEFEIFCKNIVDEESMSEVEG